jgi:hypothetical protein
MGYAFKDHDLLGRFSWKFLRDADHRQVESVMNGMLAADNKLTTGSIRRSMFRKSRGRNEFGATVYGRYDGTAPGPVQYVGRTFPETESHYPASGASVIDSGDIEDAIKLITRKGYSTQTNSRILIVANPDEGQEVMGWRAGHESRPEEGAETSGPIGKYDSIPPTVCVISPVLN